jgi:hypothetical protein
MWKHLLVQAAYQLIVLFLIIYGGPQRIEAYKLPSPCIPYSNTDGNVRPPLTASTSHILRHCTSHLGRMYFWVGASVLLGLQICHRLHWSNRQ